MWHVSGTCTGRRAAQLRCAADPGPNLFSPRPGPGRGVPPRSVHRVRDM